MTGITGTLREDRYTITILSLSVPLRTRNVADEVVEKFKHFFL